MKPLLFKCFTAIIFSLILSNLAFANGQRTEDTLILDIDASGEVDAMTDGLLMMRSMFGFTDDVLVNGAVAEDCTECDSAQIQEHISMVKGMTISQLNSAGEPGPAGPQGDKGEKGDKGDVGPAGPAGPAGALDSSLEDITIENLSVIGTASLDDLAVKGTTIIENELSVMGPSSLMGPTFIENELRVMGPTRLDHLEVMGMATIEDELRVMGLLRSDYLDVMGNTSLGDLFVNGSVQVMGPEGNLLGLYREGTTTANNIEVGPEGLLDIDTPVTMQRDLEVKGTTIFEGSTKFFGPTTLMMGPEEKLSVEGTAELNELRVMGSSSLIGPTVIEDELRIVGPVTGTVRIEDELRVMGSTRLDNLEVMGPAIIDSDLRVMGPLRSDYLEVMGNTYLGNLFINGSAEIMGPEGSLFGIYRQGAVINDREVGPEGLLSVESPASFQNEIRVTGPEGQLNVEGTTTLMGPTNILGPISFGDEFQVSGTAQMDQLFVEGNLNVMGPVSFQNGFQVESNGPNGPMLGAYSEGSTTPNGNIAGPEGLLEVASPALFHNELHVMEHLSSWKAHFLELQADNLQVESPDGQILGAYTVGSTTFNGNEVGPEGLLEVISPATFQNEIRVTGPEGQLNVEGTTTLMGPTNILGPISFGDEFQVSGTAQMDQLFVEGNLNVMGPVSFENGFQVESDSPNGPLLGVYREGSMSHNGNEAGPEGLLEVTSPATFRNELRVMGPLRSDYLDVMGYTNLGELRVHGSTRLNNLEIEGTNGSLLSVYREGATTPNDVEVGSEGLLEVTSPATFQNNLEVMGTSTFKGLTTFEGPTTLTLGPDEQFSVQGTTELSELRVMGPSMLMGPTSIDYLDVMGPSSLNELYTNGSTRLAYGPNGPILGAYREGSMTYNGNEVGPEGLLEVASPATFQNELKVMGYLSSGDLDVIGQTSLGELYVNGSAHLAWGSNGPLLGAYREGSTTHNGDPVGPEGLLQVSSPAIFQNNLEVMGSTTFKGFTTFEESTIFEAPTTLGNTTVGYLYVQGESHLGGGVFVADDIVVEGPASLSMLTVNQDAFFNQNVNVEQTLTAMEVEVSSDKRIKKDISPTKYDLKSVLKLNPVDYKLKSNNKDQTGFIAQEVKDVIPELVNGVEGDLEKGEILSINYIALIPILTKAIQQQQGQLDDQATTIDALLERITALEKNSNP